MKNYLLPSIFIPASIVISASLYSQSTPDAERGLPGNRSDHDNNITYAVTDEARAGGKWNSLRTLDLTTGAYSDVLVQLLNNNELQPPPGASNILLYNGVAAIALDQENKRLYFTPMLTDKLYYIDLRTLDRHVVTDHFTGLMPKLSDQSNIVTRMVIADDNKAYALTNDGTHLLRFRTNGNNPSITDLGSLIDAPGNNEMSVHNLCSSFGGDLIADDDDHLYLFTSRNHVFKINIQSLMAKYLGTITNLPPSFTTSGTVVNKAEKRIVVVSASDSSDVYTVNLEALIARPFNASQPFHPADLANSFTLETGERHDHYDTRIVLNNSENNDNVQLYPNPVTDKQFKLQFSDVSVGTYTLEIADVRGKSIMKKELTVRGKVNTVHVNLPAVISNGIYFVRISGLNNASYSAKILVE